MSLLTSCILDAVAVSKVFERVLEVAILRSYILRGTDDNEDSE